MSANPSICAACNQEIKVPQCAVVDGKKYHVEHFVCKTCSKQLGGQKFKKKEGAVYCEDCFAQQFAPTCPGCETKILGKHIIVEDKRFHSNCFVCQFCTKPFNQDGYYKEQDKFICKVCLTHRKNRKCAKCEQLIEDNEIYALEQYWHPGCLRCAKCDKELADSSFLNMDGKPYHVECVNQKCVVCGKQVESEYYEVENGFITHVNCIDQYKPDVHTSIPEVKEQQELKQEEQKQEQKQEQVEEKKEENKPVQNQKYQLKTMDQQDKNSLDPNVLDPNRPRYEMAVLRQNPPPEGVPPNKKELYLSDEDFEKTFKMKLTRFLALKEWKRIELKKQQKLF